MIETYLKVLCFILFALCCTLFATIFYMRRKAKKEKDKIRLFLSTTAHDIRSPLAGIKGYSDALLSGDLSEDKKEQALFIISSETSRLAAIADRLSHENEKIKVNAEIFGICELLRTVFLSLERKMETSGIKVSFSFDDEDEIYVRSDKNLIHEALFNICDNAVKYCEDKNIYADVRTDGRKVKISVSNKTADADFSGYFEKGARGNTKVKGTGLGLYISKKLINACLSELYAEKNADVITFSFDLPHIEAEK